MKSNAMKDLLYNLDSVEVSYGDNILNSVVQVNEQIEEILRQRQTSDFNGFEKSETADRIQKLVDLNQKVQKELQKQLEKLHKMELSLMTTL
jgi:hypothetical protein